MARSRSHRSVDIWPGFVDALSTLIIALIFLLVVFFLAQFLLNFAISGKDEALGRLTQQVNELTDLLNLERGSAAELRLSVAQLSAQLQNVNQERDQLAARLSALSAEHDALTGRLQTETAEKDKLRVQLGELESLKRDVATLREARERLEQEVLKLGAALQESEGERLKGADALAALQREMTAARDRGRELESSLSGAEERTALAQRELKDREVRLAELLALSQQAETDLRKERSLSADAQRQVGLLNQQLTELRAQLERLNAALNAAEKDAKDKGVVIADLGRRLNMALASRVEELSRYRSEFFGRLREALGNRPDVTIVGDRFVFQSEVLFDSGSADLNAEGQAQLVKLARTLAEVARDIPRDLPWVLRIDGHTDRVPISTPKFASNWELSSARAISVVRHLIAQGIPPSRVAATGFAEYQPIDNGGDEIALRRNRRIEVKLTER